MDELSSFVLAIMVIAMRVFHALQDDARIVAIYPDGRTTTIADYISLEELQRRLRQKGH